MTGKQGFADTREASLELRKKRLGVRCRARGTLELCVLLGRFLNSVEGELDPTMIGSIEALLEEADQDILDWSLGAAECPERHAGAISLFRSLAIPARNK